MIDDFRRRLLISAFKMPSVQTMVSRKSSITNAFVSAIIPAIPPTCEEIEQALKILGMEPTDLRCAYCGDKATEWDHLRPLVMNRRPTGYISEIGNLVPSCGPCNQSKGNKPWHEWILSKARLSPAGRGVADQANRIAKLEAYEKWLAPTKVDFVSILGPQRWEEYWMLCDAMNEKLRECQKVANSIRAQIAQTAHRK